MGRPIVISVLGDTKGLGKALGEGESRLSRFGSTAGKVGRVAALGVAAGATALGALGLAAVKSASDAQQSLGATETVFGKYADQVVAKSKTAATAVGLSGNAYRENANLIGSLFKNQGVAADQLASKTDKVVRLGADLSATFGGSATQAVEALSSAYKGEFDPLERYGISLKQSTINAELARKGQDKLTGAALAAAKQQATTALIMRQSKDSAGAFGRETNTLAHQQQVLGAQWEDLKTKAGNGLLPVLTRLGLFATGTLVPAIGRLGGPTKELASAIGDRLGQAFRTVSPLLQAAASTFQGTILPAIVRLGSYVGRTFGPILAGVGRILLGQVLPTIVKFGTFLYGTLYPAVARIVIQVGQNLRPAFDAIAKVVVTNVLPAVSSLMGRLEAARPTIQRVLSATVSLVGGVLRFASAVLGKVLPPIIRLAGPVLGGMIRTLGVVITVAAKVVGAIIGLGRGVVNGVKAFVTFSNRVDATVRAIPGKVLGALSGAGRLLLGKGRDLITGLVSGLKGAFGLLTNLGGLKAKVTGVLSNAGSWLYSAGARLIQGLIDGISSKIKAVGDKMAALASKVKGYLPGSPVKEGPLKSWNNGGAGKRLIDLLAYGLGSTKPIRAAMSTVAGTINGGLTTALGGSSLNARTALADGPVSAGGVNITLNVEVPVGGNPYDIGRTIQAYLDAYLGGGGRKA